MTAPLTTTVTTDPHGTPPGQLESETGYMGAKGTVKFRGKFYAFKHKLVEFERPIIVLTVLRKVIVLLDEEMGNTYVIDRDTNISMGCLMHAVVTVDGNVIQRAQ